MESVLVVPREVLFPKSAPHGLLAFAEESRSGQDQSGRGPAGHAPVSQDGTAPTAAEFEALVLHHGFFVERDYAERTPALKQVIPYALVIAREGLMLTRRLSAGGESRLHDKLSIGIGGHIDPEDACGIPWTERRELSGAEARGRHPLVVATRRELLEELDVQGPFEIASVGLLNDDSNPVGAVHLGVVQTVTVEGSVTVRERHLLEGQLVSSDHLRELRAQGANYETWSALLVDRIDELLCHSPRPFPHEVPSQ
jgi:predicted NUDIX family phosphoesterase